MSGPLTVASPEHGPGQAAPGSSARSANDARAGSADARAESDDARAELDDVRAELDALEDALGLDIAEVLARAVELERAAESGGEAVLRMRARLLQADVWQRQGQTAAASRLLREVEAWASEHDSDVLKARIDRLLARIYYALGDVAACLEHAVLALQRLDADAPARTRSAYLMALAGALNATGSYDAARERYQQAERFAIAGADVPRQLAVLNNEAYSELEAGDPERAWKVVERLRAVAAEHEYDLNPNYLDTVAQAQLALGRYADAEVTTRASIEAISGAWEQEVDSLAQFLATLAIAQRRLGRIEAAQATLDRCRVLCEERELATIGVQVVQEQAELYAAAGDFRRAFAEYKAFHVAHSRLISQQGEARARTRQAMFETAEALQNAARFHDQARRDPLTGLPNRRYIDEVVPAMLLESARTGEPLVVGFVDADHFKRVNDTCSHQVGDQVLIALAGLLTAAVPTGPGTGFAARAGGEEFLLVLAGLDVPAAIQHLETFRLAVAGHPWQPLTGELSVTVSVGIAAAGPGSTQSELFARADEALYTAKRDGRNRVCVAR